MKKLTQYLLGVATCVALTSAAHAALPGSILSPVGVLTNTLGNAGVGDDLHMIDQSGLSSGFTSGITDFNSYLAGNPTHTTIYFGYEWFPSFSFDGSQLPGVFVFDLGSVYSIDAMAIWNEESGGVKDIMLSIPSGPVLGLYTVASDAAYLSVGSYPAQVLTFGPIATQFIELTMYDYYGTYYPSPSIGELAFRLTAIPEPSTYAAVLGLGSLLGVGFLKRTKKAE